MTCEELKDLLYMNLDYGEYLDCAKLIDQREAQMQKLRYERLIARYRYFYLLAYHYACEGEAKDSKKSKCTRIAEAYEARARKIKEEM